MKIIAKLIFVILFAVFVGLPASSTADDRPRFRVLVFSKTDGFRHDSIPAGIEAIRKLGAANDFGVDATEDAGSFTGENLDQYDAIVFLNTTQDVLDDAQQEAFQMFIREGGGFAGVHSAADTEYDWPWYGELVGAYFDSHPQQQDADVLVLDRDHPSTSHLPERWRRFDEWYNYRANPDDDIDVLAALDEDSYEGGTMGDEHAIAWAHEYDGGRAWYTGLGHTIESYSEPLFLEHLLGGIEWAAGAADDVTEGSGG